MAKFRLRLWHKFELLAALPMVICAAMLLILGCIYTYTDNVLSKAARAREAMDTSEYLVRTITQVTAKLWTGGADLDKQTAQKIVDTTTAKVNEKLEKLKELCKGNAAVEKTSQEVEETIRTSLQIMQRSVDMKTQHAIATKLKIISFQMATQEQAAELSAVNQKLADQLMSGVPEVSTASTSDTMQPLIVSASIIIALIGALTAFILNRNVVTRLSALVTNSKRLAKLDTLVPPASRPDDDEIADLDEIFHTMAGSLAEAIARERASIEKAADVICTLDSNGKIENINSACIAAWGYQPDEVVRKTILDFVHHDDRNRTQTFLAALKHTEDMETFENRILKPNGTAIDILWSFRKSETGDEIFSIAHDITERKRVQENLRKSEDRFAAIKEKMPAALIIFNENGGVLDFNPGATSLTGRNASDLRKTNLEKIIPALPAEVRNLAQRSLPHESEILQSDGTIKVADMIIEKLDSNANQQEYLSVMIDTTDRHELEKIKETLVAMIAHDIATPMTTIHSQLHLAQLGAMGALTDDGMEMVRSAEAQSVELMNVLTTVMKTAKYKHGNILKGLTETDLADIVDATVESTGAEQQQQNVSIHVQIDRSLKLIVEPDSTTHALKVVLGMLMRRCTENQMVSIESFHNEDDIDGRALLRFSHPRATNDVDAAPPTSLAWEFACAILQANNGSLKFVAEQKFIAYDFQFRIAVD